MNTPVRLHRIVNVHRRNLPAPPDRLAHLIDSLSTPDDALWPNARWPRMKLDPGLQRGAKGGHGPIRYFVQEYIPGRNVRFRFTAPIGFDGTHEFVLERTGAGEAVLGHILQMDAHGIAKVKWAVFYRPLHDALLEDALDRAEAHARGVEWQPRPLSAGVRLLRWIASRFKP
jgi:hypothetical protein